MNCLRLSILFATAALLVIHAPDSTNAGLCDLFGRSSSSRNVRVKHASYSNFSHDYDPWDHMAPPPYTEEGYKAILRDIEKHTVLERYCRYWQSTSTKDDRLKRLECAAKNFKDEKHDDRYVLTVNRIRKWYNEGNELPLQNTPSNQPEDDPEDDPTHDSGTPTSYYSAPVNTPPRSWYSSDTDASMVSTPRGQTTPPENHPSAYNSETEGNTQSYSHQDPTQPQSYPQPQPQSYSGYYPPQHQQQSYSGYYPPYYPPQPQPQPYPEYYEDQQQSYSGYYPPYYPPQPQPQSYPEYYEDQQQSYSDQPQQQPYSEYYPPQQSEYPSEQQDERPYTTYDDQPGGELVAWFQNNYI